VIEEKYLAFFTTKMSGNCFFSSQKLKKIQLAPQTPAKFALSRLEYEYILTQNPCIHFYVFIYLFITVSVIPAPSKLSRPLISVVSVT
jgi:hypothetical protein